MSVEPSPKFSFERAYTMQMQLAKLIIREDTLPEAIHSVAGVDVAYTEKISIGAVAVLDLPSLKPLESHVARVNTRFPYIPTLLSYREIPPAYAAIRKLETHPDVFLVDAHGIMHPRRFGFASHLGLIVDKPTIGIAKNPIQGTVKPGLNAESSIITDRGEVIGVKLFGATGKRPVYISIGHKISLERALNLVKRCFTSHAIPEPIRKAHLLATEEKRRLIA
jgi:deoxyribonuclease V